MTAPSDDEPPEGSPFRTMIVRGIFARCPICGSGHLYKVLKLRERCPRCGHRFERRNEDGFFLGAYLINLSIALVLLAGVLMAYGLSLDGSAPGSGLSWGIAALVVTILGPLVTYRSSKTLWAAIDLTLHPQDEDEQRSALAWLAHRAHGDDRPS